VLRVLIFDPFAGISGDMTIAALLDLGLDEAWLRGFVADLGIGDVQLHVERVMRRGIAAPHIRFEYPPEKAHRHLRHVLEIIDRSKAPPGAKERAADAFRRIADAEARVHGTTIEKVHFHEVGAMDAILDVVCIMAGVAELGFDECRTRPVAVGSGWIDIEHGHYPVPAPATLGILRGVTVTGTELKGECTTPTGAAVLATLTGGRSAPSEFAPGRIGFGAGSRDFEDRPNVLRLIEATTATATGSLWLLQADIDDLAPEYVAAAQQNLLRAGALDAVLLSASMKKGRPGIRIEVLVPAAHLHAVEHALFLATSTIGVRRWPVERSALPRESREIHWRGQRIRMKHVTLPDGSTRRKPEFEDVAAAAAALGISAWEVRSALQTDGGDAGDRTGGRDGGDDGASSA
jgi:pyridinium-3,5-bisthiocarboxylic acid mononucleotide nickel chelatase